MNTDCKRILIYIVCFFLIMAVSFLWIGYPGAVYKDFILENIVSPVFFTFITLSWTRFRIGKTFRTKFEYFCVIFLLFFVLVCMIGQTYHDLNLETAFCHTFTIIVIDRDKILTLFIIPLIVGFLIDRLVSTMEKFEKS